VTTALSSTGVAGLVLAAGAGTRFGAPKALAELDGELFVDRAVRLLRAGNCEPVVVVLGAAAEEVIARARLAGVHVVVAPDWADGMSASLRAGLDAAAATPATAVVVALVDQPWIGAGSIERLRQAWESGAVAAVATYDGKPRNPVLLDRSVWAAVASAATGDVGARDWLRANPDQVERVNCDGTGDPADVDVATDLADHGS
jgi:CTP:molybdopterin cytidylyltransferase MocA